MCEWLVVWTEVAVQCFQLKMLLSFKSDSTKGRPTIADLVTNEGAEGSGWYKI